jgi:hypothetical protein
MVVTKATRSPSGDSAAVVIGRVAKKRRAGRRGTGSLVRRREARSLVMLSS